MNRIFKVLVFFFFFSSFFLASVVANVEAGNKNPNGVPVSSASEKKEGSPPAKNLKKNTPSGVPRNSKREVGKAQTGKVPDKKRKPEEVTKKKPNPPFPQKDSPEKSAQKIGVKSDGNKNSKPKTSIDTTKHEERDKVIAESKKNRNDENKALALVAEVNGQPVSAYAFEKLLIEQLQTGINDSVELRKKIRDELVVQTLLSQMAMEEGLSDNDEVEMAFESAKRSILSNAWRQNWAKENPISDQEVIVEYNATIKKLGVTEYQLRQVVVPDETAALLLLEQLEDGKDLADLASKYTTEAGGKKSMGLLPWVSPSLLLPPLGDLISKAEKGELLGSPVRTQAGWHVVRIEGVRTLDPPSVDQLRPQLTRGILQRRMTQRIQQLLDKAEIKF